MPALFSSALWNSMVRIARSPAAFASHRGDVDPPGARLEVAKPADHPAITRKSQERRHFMFARWARTPDSPRYRRHTRNRARSSAKIDGARFSFRKGDRHFMSNEELTERVRGIIASTQHLPKEKVTANSTFEELGIDS